MSTTSSYDNSPCPPTQEFPPMRSTQYHPSFALSLTQAESLWDDYHDYPSAKAYALAAIDAMEKGLLEPAALATLLAMLEPALKGLFS